MSKSTSTHKPSTPLSKGSPKGSKELKKGTRVKNTGMNIGLATKLSKSKHPKKHEYKDLVESSKKAEKKAAKRRRDKEGETVKKAPRTIESMRVHDITEVTQDDEETFNDIAHDEFADYFNGKPPKILITTNRSPTKEAYHFARVFSKILQNCTMAHRKIYTLKDVTLLAEKKGFTDIIVINENKKKVSDLLIAHLPKGPIAHFKIFNILYPEQIKVLILLL